MYNKTNDFLEETTIKKIAILTDSACDISDKIIQKYDIKIIPLCIHFENKTYRDRVEIEPKKLYELLKTEIAKTSQPIFDDVQNALDEIKREGYEEVLYIGISSGLSGTFNFVKSIGEKYEGMNFYSFDTKTLSCAQGMIVTLAANLIKKINDINKLITELTKLREKMTSLFIVKDITYLVRGGRISRFMGIIGNLFKVCPIVTVNDGGSYSIFSKTLSFPRSLQTMVNEIKNRFSNSDIKISIVHGLEEDLAKSVLAKIKTFSNVIEEQILPVTSVLGVHTGPGLIGIIAHKC